MTERPSPRTLSYQQLRGIILAIGFLVLAVVALVMFTRRVDPIEVAATMLFLPVFIGFLFWGIRGGALVAVVAAAIYFWLRGPAIDAVGMSAFTGQLVARAAGYLVFGIAGGWAVNQLQGSILKLELYDQVDDATGLFNARSFAEAIDLERSRASRYQKIFSIIVAEFSLDPNMSKRRRQALLRDLGTRIEHSIRAVDHPVHSVEGDTHLLAFVLPETSSTGAETFTQKLRHQLSSVLRINPDDVSVATYPDSEERVQEIVNRFKAISRTDYPESNDSI